MQRTEEVTRVSNNSRQKLYKCYINACGNRNLPDRLLKSRELYELFSKYGDVIQISYKNGNNGIAFCFYESRESINEASKCLNRKRIDGVKICVREAENISYYEKTYDKKIVIGNIQEDVSEKMLKAHLERYGKVSSIQRISGTNKYEVTFADLMGVNKYIQLRDLYSIDDEEIRMFAANERRYSVKLELKICKANEPFEIEEKPSEFSIITTTLLEFSLVFGILLSAHSLITKMRNKK